MAIDATLSAKLRSNPLAAGVTKAFSQGGIVGKPNDGSGEALAVPRRHDQPGLSVNHGFGIAAHPGDDHRQAGRHALEDRVGKALLVRTQNTYITRAKQRGNVVTRAKKQNVVAQAELPGLFVQRRANAIVAPDHQHMPMSRQLRRRLPKRINQIAMPFVRNEIGDDTHNQRILRQTKTRARLVAQPGRAEIAFVDTVVDQPKPSRRNTFGLQLIDDPMRIAENGVHGAVPTALHSTDERAAMIGIEAAPAHNPAWHAGQHSHRRADQISGGQKEMHYAWTPPQHEPEQMQRRQRNTVSSGRVTTSRCEYDFDAVLLQRGPHLSPHEAVDGDIHSRLDERRREQCELPLAAADPKTRDYK